MSVHLVRAPGDARRRAAAARADADVMASAGIPPTPAAPDLQRAARGRGKFVDDGSGCRRRLILGALLTLAALGLMSGLDWYVSVMFRVCNDERRPVNPLMLSILLASAAIGGLRFFVPGHDLTLLGAYQDFAHILVGILLVLCCLRPTEWVLCAYPVTAGVRRLAIVCLIGITLIEIVMFAAR